MAADRYIPSATNAHGREEELQWARLLAAGDPACGMALVLMQKLCTAFHEFEPAWRRGALHDGHLAYFRGRLAGRAQRTVQVLLVNGLGEVEGAAELAALTRTIEAAQTMDELAGLTERIHAVGHTLCEALERAGEARRRAGHQG